MPTNKPKFCADCPITDFTTGYVPLKHGYGSTLLVGEAAGAEEAEKGLPFVGGAGTWLTSMCSAAKVSRPSLNIINSIGCRPANNVYPSAADWSATSREDGRAAVRYCHQHHLLPVLESRPWSKIITLGNEALEAVTGRSGITQWRGSALQAKHLGPDHPPVVMPTLHPAYLMRVATLFSVSVNDLRKSLEIPAENYNLYATVDDFAKFDSSIVSIDFEWDRFGDVTLVGIGGSYGTGLVSEWTPAIAAEVQRIVENAKMLIGHNLIGAEMKYIEKWNWKLQPDCVLFCTMLGQHLIQPDMKHDLGFVASVFTNKVFWKGRGDWEEDSDTGELTHVGAQWKTWDRPDAIPRAYGGYGGCSSADEAYRLYNARDFDGTLMAARPIQTLLDKYGMWDVYRLVSVPFAWVCREMSSKGLRIDTNKVGKIRDDLATQIAKVELVLPEGLKPYEKEITKTVPAPANTYKPKKLKCKGTKKANTIHEPCAWEATTPGDSTCPVCGTIKPNVRLSLVKRIKVPAKKRITPWNSSDQVKQYASSIGLAPAFNLKTGRETADKSARKRWGRTNTEFTAVDTLKKLSTQRNSFAKPGLLSVDRVYFNILPHGTSEGRSSSSGQRRGIDPNIQNQPKAIRKIFIPDRADFGILDSDFMQGENMITTWLAKDWDRWERLNQPGYDEHSDMAHHFFNKPIELVSKGGAEEYLRAPGKVINHGRNYGLGEKKTQQYLMDQGFFYSLADIKEMINIWKKVNARTFSWQNETIALAKQQGYLRNEFGRRRFFQSRDFATKALAFLPASTLADIKIRCLIGLHPIRFAKEIAELQIAQAWLPKDWFLNIEVHDSLVAQGPQVTHLAAASALREVMQQPWKELGGFKLKVEVKYGTESWGDCRELEGF